MHRAVLASLTLLALVPLMAPATAQQVGTVELTANATYTQLVARLGSTIESDDAARLRGAADQNGDSDGYASQREVDALMLIVQAYLGGRLEQSLGGENLTLDGNAGTAELTSLRAFDAAGPINSTADLRFEAEGRVFLRPARTAHHTLVLRGNDGATNATLTVRAAPGDVIASAAGLQGTLSDDSNSITGRRQDANITLVLGPPVLDVLPTATPTSASGVPGPAVALLATALLAGALAMRRRHD